MEITVNFGSIDEFCNLSILKIKYAHESIRLMVENVRSGIGKLI